MVVILLIPFCRWRRWGIKRLNSGSRSLELVFLTKKDAYHSSQEKGQTGPNHGWKRAELIKVIKGWLHYVGITSFPCSHIFLANFLLALFFHLGCWLNFCSVKHYVKYEKSRDRCEKNVVLEKFCVLLPEGNLATHQLTCGTCSGLTSL